MSTTTDDFLAHYGIKGMKWGVIRRDRSSGATKGSSQTKGNRELNKIEVERAAKALNTSVVKNGANSADLASKYGPSSLKKGVDPPKDDRSFYEKHKTAIRIGAGVAAAGLVAYGGYKYHQTGMYDKTVGSVRDKMARKSVDKARQNLLDDYSHLSLVKVNRDFDPDKLDDTPIHLPKGTIFKRVSTEPETNLKSTGVFASYEDADVERYKAILPTFWPMWGIQKKAGYVVNIQADSDIRAPSPKKSYEIFRDMLSDPSYRSLVDPEGYLSELSTDALARNSFQDMATHWNAPDVPSVKMYLDKVKSSGYNALHDQNDSGNLAKNPMFLLNTEAISIRGHDVLSERDIGQAQIREAKKIKN